jgi:hypothetical protein
MPSRIRLESNSSNRVGDSSSVMWVSVTTKKVPTEMGLSVAIFVGWTERSLRIRCGSPGPTASVYDPDCGSGTTTKV